LSNPQARTANSRGKKKKSVERGKREFEEGTSGGTKSPSTRNRGGGVMKKKCHGSKREVKTERGML